MVKVLCVGLGSLGSGLVAEIAKRSLALKFPLELHCYDDDKVEERNVVAQAFDPTDIGKTKVGAVMERLTGYDLLKVQGHELRVLADNIHDVMDVSGSTIIIDAVDNVPTRQLLWQHGVMMNTPVLHMGMSTAGSGEVSWNWQNVDTFGLSPANLSPAKQAELDARKAEKQLPPCELNSMRGLITNTVLAANDALFLFLGKDSTKLFVEAFGDEEVPGVLTTWTTSTKSHALITPMTKMLEWTN